MTNAAHNSLSIYAFTATRVAALVTAAAAMAALATGCLDYDEPEVEFLENGITVSPNAPLPPMCVPDAALGEYLVPIALNDTTGRILGTFDPNNLIHIYVGRDPATDFRALMPLLGPTPLGVSNARLCFHVNAAAGAQNVVAGHVGVPLGTVSNVTGPFAVGMGWNVVDVTTIVQDWGRGLHANNGIGLREVSGGLPFNYSINSADHAFNQPFVIIQ